MRCVGKRCTSLLMELFETGVSSCSRTVRRGACLASCSAALSVQLFCLVEPKNRLQTGVAKSSKFWGDGLRLDSDGLVQSNNLRAVKSNRSRSEACLIGHLSWGKLLRRCKELNFASLHCVYFVQRTQSSVPQRMKRNYQRLLQTKIRLSSSRPSSNDGVRCCSRQI